MKWFRRGRRFSLGRYVPPTVVHHASIDEMVDDGVLIAAAAIRLAVTNLVILKALRDRVDYSIERTTEAVQQELENLATEKDGDALRITQARDIAASRGGGATSHSDYRQADVAPLDQRATVSGRLAERLRELRADDEFVRGLVVGAHAAAWEEIGASITAKATSSTGARPDARYKRERGDRLLRLLGDLNDLEANSRQKPPSAPTSAARS